MASLQKAVAKKTPAVAVKKKVPVAPAKAAPAKKVAAKAAPAKKAPARKTAAAGARPARPSWDAPADFKPAFFEFRFNTDAQALITPSSLQGCRYRGKWDNPEAKMFNLREYDVNTLVGFAARMSAALWAPNVLRRVTPNASWRVIVRCNRRAADNSLATRIVGVFFKAEGKKGRWFEDKTEADFRKIRRVARFLPAAFTDVQLPPSRRSKKTEEADEE